MTFFTHWTLGYDIHLVSEELLSPVIDLKAAEDLQDSYGYMMNSCIAYYMYVNITVIIYFSLRNLKTIINKYFRLCRYNLCGLGETKSRIPKNVKFQDHLAKLVKHKAKKQYKTLYGVHF